MDQPTPETKTYLVHVKETVTTVGVVLVEAATQAEARELAVEQFDSATDVDDCYTFATTLLEEDGMAVEWCKATAVVNPENPYRLCPERRA